MCFKMSCSHTFYETNYCTSVCYDCGLEKPAGITPLDGYTTNVPLCNGYSRHHRMYMLLKQLFDPRHYGSPNSEVIAHMLQHGPFQHGNQLLKWLAQLKVKHKQYQNAHYYYAIASPTYVIPDPPCPEKLIVIERTFYKLEQRFSAHTYKSFFSYNWLLRKFLQVENLPFYLQFVKSIKCKKRLKTYETMWIFFTRADRVVATQDVSRSFQTQLVGPLENVGRPHLEQPFCASQWLRNYQSNSDVPA